ncbi:MAG: response regulator, partial [Acidimicrobiia bacterium]|nr:response regulator [Acidimicrobiia bacterium]
MRLPLTAPMLTRHSLNSIARHISPACCGDIDFGYHRSVTHVLLATDSDSVFNAVDAALGGDAAEISRVRAGVEVLDAVREREPDLVICDLQIGNMGGMATCLDLRLEAEMGRAPETRVLMLLDREADVYLAKQAGSDGWLVKPLDAVS